MIKKLLLTLLGNLGELSAYKIDLSAYTCRLYKD